MNTTELLNKAFKAITVADLGSSRLVPEQAERFVRIIERESVLLGETRRLTMRNDRRNIDRTGFSEPILRAAQAEATEFTPRVEPSFFTNELVAVKGRGAAAISDETLEENIERGNFETTLVDLIAARAAIDLEEAFMIGDSAGVGDALVDVIDGWLKKAANTVTGSATPGPGQFNQTDIEDMFDKMLLAVDDRYLRNLDEWRYYVTWAMANDYRDTLRARATALGDEAQTQANPLRFKGIRVLVVPVQAAGRALLTNRHNTVYGIRREIEIEPERKAGFDRWDFHVRVKGDCHYEDENAAVDATGYVGS